MEIKVNISNEDTELVADSFKYVSTGYPTDDSDVKIVNDAVQAYVRSVVSQYQTFKLQEQAAVEAQNIADNVVLE